MPGIGDRIRQGRDALGLSQEELGAQVDVSREAVSQWENGDTRPRDARLEKIAKVLGVDYAWLRTGAGSISLAETEVQRPLDPELLRALILEGFSFDLPAQGARVFADRVIEAYAHILEQREARRQLEGGLISTILRRDRG